MAMKSGKISYGGRTKPATATSTKKGGKKVGPGKAPVKKTATAKKPGMR